MTNPPPTLHGRPIDEVARRTGILAQVARIDRLVEDDGHARGARRIRLVTGGGLEVEIHPDRALDLGQVTYRGTPIAWMSPTGMVAPDPSPGVRSTSRRLATPDRLGTRKTSE